MIDVRKKSMYIDETISIANINDRDHCKNVQARK